jgi:hypothetical protein
MPAKAYAALGALFALLSISTLAFSAEHFVYTATSSATENAIVVYHQAADGTLQFYGTNPTQGQSSTRRLSKVSRISSLVTGAISRAICNERATHQLCLHVAF